MRISLFSLLLTAVLVGSVNADCPGGDLNRDCQVDFLDVQVLAQEWLTSPESSADINGDDRVDIDDFALLAEQYPQKGIPLAINEIMASNSSCIEDPQGEFDDWIEIYNYGTDAIDIAGMYLTDNLSVPTKWRIPSGNPAATNIPAGGYLLIWADNDTGDIGLHANFKLDAGGEEIALFDTDGSTLIDSVTFNEQTGDISYGRHPDASNNWQFFGFPSPLGENTSVYQGFVKDVEFSQKRGFYDTPFSVTLANETEDAVIYYTLDGTEPYEPIGQGRSGTVYSGTVYTAPVLISKTSCLRAIAIKMGWKPSDIKTHTYIFLNDVIIQSRNGQPPGPKWPTSSVNGQVINYGMDPEVVDSGQNNRSNIKNALLAIPTISFVTDLDNLFDSSKGIYVNASREGRAWERPTSVELLNPDGSKGFQIDAGLRIRGGFSRSANNPKHAFRLFFRAEYGEAKLRFPLYGEEGVDEFDCVDLRTSQNYSWSFQGSSRNTMVREVFSRDLQGEMGQPYTRSRYYHLYINGHYWGIFQTQERSEASYAESYFGGDKEDYDVVKVDRSVGRGMLATDGNMEAYSRLYNAAKAGFRDNAAYYRVQGLNPDGTPNPNYEKLLDVDNLIDFMVIEYYTGDRDGPGSRYGNIPNNTFSIYNRKNPDGFKWFQHDSEHSLGTGEENLVTPLTWAGAQWTYFNPHWLHEQLITTNADYRQRFGDRIQKHMFNGGLLTPDVSISRIDTRVAQIELAIIAESARWGDSSHHPPYTKNDWLIAVSAVRNWINGRNPILLNQFRGQNWFPNIDAPVFRINGLYKHGGRILPTDRFSMAATTGTIYYTLDGSDSCLPQTLPDSSIDTTLIAENSVKRVLVPTGPISDDWKGGRQFSDRDWPTSVGSPGGVGYERSSGYQTYISLDVQTQMYNGNTSCYVRIPFTVNGDPKRFDFMTLKMRYDDGFVAYINGIEVQRALFAGTPVWNSNADGNHEAGGVESFYVSDYISALKQGDNILAIHGLNVSTTSSDFIISAELIAGESSGSTGNSDISPSAIQYWEPITLNHSVHVKARVLNGGTWSALNEATFAIGPVEDNLRITEIMYRPQDPDEEYIELKNIGTETINLNLTKFTKGIDFIFPSLELAPNEYVVVVQDRNAFEARYGTDLNIAGEYSGRLNNAGERIRLQDAIGQTILDFDYKDGWRSITDDGYSLTIIDPISTDTISWNEKDSWRASAYVGGSPGDDDSGIVPDPGAVVINEVLAHSHDEASDWIELYNTTGTTIDIGSWFLSDSKDNLTKYEIAKPTTIGPYNYIVFREDMHFNNISAPGSHEPFALSENGDQLYLSSAENGVITGYRSVEDFGASATGVSFGRYYKSSTDNYNFVPMEYNTQGSANSYPKVGPIVISEIMYNPDWPAGGSYTNDQYEYVELHNISAESVTLYCDDKDEPWKFTDGIEFTFPDETPVTIAAGGYLLLVKKPEAFSWRYPGVPAENILGPYDAELSNTGDRLELSMPGDVDKFGVRQYIRIDRVVYSDGSHPEDCPGGVDLWPIDADGGGKSLTRKVLTDYDNDPANWNPSTPSPGE